MKRLLYLLALLLSYTSSMSAQTTAGSSDEPTPGWAIDLGLSVKWAAYNVGADSPAEFGGYYAWGETWEKDYYVKTTYWYYTYYPGYYSFDWLSASIGGSQDYDAATALWHGDWRMPSHSHFVELVSKCTSKWITYRGVSGYLFTGPNGNSIFLPASGLYGKNIGGQNISGAYWSSSQYASGINGSAYSLNFTSKSIDTNTVNDVFGGRSIRPIISVDGDPGVQYPADKVKIKATSYSRKYGEMNPLQYNYTVIEGSITSGTPTLVCETEKTTDVGCYPIRLKKGSISNSTVYLVCGTLEVEAAPLTAFAGDYTKVMGEENPTFTPTYSGFVNDETDEVLTRKPTITTKVTKTTPVGIYPVTISGAKAKNYDITHKNGTLTIQTTSAIIGDLDGDGKVDGTDLVILVNKILTAEKGPVADLNGDGVVDGADYVLMVNKIMEK